MAPRGRFELPTFRLTAERSTIELPGNRRQLGLSDGVSNSLANAPRQCQRRPQEVAASFLPVLPFQTLQSSQKAFQLRSPLKTTSIFLLF
jgi:hypothetical protein